MLDVTLKEDANKTTARTAALNLNTMRKWVVAILRNIDLGKKLSLKLKTYALSMDPELMLQMLTHVFDN